MNLYRYSKVGFLCLVLAAICTITVSAQNPTDSARFPTLTGPYLGQTPPGIEPVRFAEGIIPIDDIEHCFPTFSPDGNEVYWMTLKRGSKPKIMYAMLRDGKWTSPA